MRSPRVNDPKINIETAILSINDKSHLKDVPKLNIGAYHGVSGNQSKSTAI